MTNQNDTQDEAERLALEIYPTAQSSAPQYNENQREKRNIYVMGYRAGVATVADKRLELAAKYSDLAAKYCASLVEVERLKKHLDLALASGLDASEQLAAEKQKALKLVELLIEAVELMKRPPAISTGDRAWHQQDVIIQIDKTISDYSTDSGDGEKG